MNGEAHAGIERSWPPVRSWMGLSGLTLRQRSKVQSAQKRNQYLTNVFSTVSGALPPKRTAHMALSAFNRGQ
eukprot:1267593-Amphidinium_carterae.1